MEEEGEGRGEGRERLQPFWQHAGRRPGREEEEEMTDGTEKIPPISCLMHASLLCVLMLPGEMLKVLH